MELKDYLYYQDDAGEIYCGDCIEIMPLLADKSIDLVLTDPPYGSGRQFANDEDTPIELLKIVYCELFRVAKPDCFLISDWSRQKVLTVPEFIGEWNFLDLLAVTQENTMAFCRVGFDVFQIKLLFGKGKPKVIKRGWNLYKTARLAKQEKFVHPTMKQVDVYKKGNFERPRSS